MLVRSVYPEIVVNLKGATYQFKDYLCEIPDGQALQLLNTNNMYSLAKIEGGQVFKPFNGATWTKNKKIIWDGPLCFANGYGKSSMEMIKALNKVSDLYTVCDKWCGNSDEYIDDDLRKLVNKTPSEVDSYYIKYYPGSAMSPRIAEREIGFTMFECTRIPDGGKEGKYPNWVTNLNNMERVFCPSQDNKKYFIESGVTRDITVIPLGVNPDRLPEVKFIDDGNFVFGTMGTLTYRKGTDVLVKAFEKAFPKEQYPNVQLYLKTQATGGGIVNGWFMEGYADDQRISLNMKIMPDDELHREFFSKINCFVFPTRGEGFGLPPMEAMACGIPTICTNWSGTGDFLTNKNSYPLSYKMGDMPNGDWRGYPLEFRAEGQRWAEPNEEELVELMKHVYEHRDEAYAKGKVARKFILGNYTWADTARKIVEALDKKF